MCPWVNCTIKKSVIELTKQSSHKRGIERADLEEIDLSLSKQRILKSILELKTSMVE